jgi:hypothetical protein
MSRLLHVSFSVGTPPGAVTDIHRVINDNAIDWAHYISNCYLIWTQIELATWTNILRTVPNMDTGNFFICAIDPNSPIEGWLPKWAWEWLLQYRGVHAQPSVGLLGPPY